MNTTPAPSESQPALTDLVEEEPDDHSQAVKALSAAQEEITALKDQLREERLGWIVVLVILFDCFFLLNAQNAGGPLVIGILEFAALSVLAARMGVEEFAALFKNVFHRMADGVSGSKD
jgi:hypothetical protein